MTIKQFLELVKTREALTKASKAIDAAIVGIDAMIDSELRWARFIYFCNTGRML